MDGFELQRLGMLMEPQPGNLHEAEGVLNPGPPWPGRALYLFPRMVASGNYSRIGIARVQFNEAGDPEGVERLGIALEPETDYECGIDGRGGCEDPRVTFIEPLQRYLMTYTARSSRGPRIAAACSTDLFTGSGSACPFRAISRLGCQQRGRQGCLPIPAAIPNPSGHPELALLHRPLFPGVLRRRRRAEPHPTR